MVDIPSVPLFPETAEWTVGVHMLQNGWRPTGGPVNPGADQGLLNWPLQEMVNREVWLKKRIDEMSQTVGQVIMVGPGQQYPTINAALADVSRMGMGYTPGGAKIELRLAAGFVMEEQVIVDGINLGWVRITGVDPQTTIRRSALTVDMGSTSFPAFCAKDGGVLPQIYQLFEMDGTGVALNRDGIMVRGMGASADVGAGCGVKRAGACGLRAQAGGTVSAFQGVFTQAGTNGLEVHSGAGAACASCDFSGAGDTGIYAWLGGQVSAQNSIVTGYTNYGIRARQGAIVNALGLLAQKAGADLTSDIAITQGGIIAAATATGGTLVAPNTVSASGIIFK